MIQNVILRNIGKTLSTDVDQLDNFDMIPENLQSTFWLTCKFAYECLANDRIIFSKHDLLSNFPEILQGETNFLCFGLLQSAQSLVDSGHKLSFHFLHLTFQEFLAALYLSTLRSDEKLKLFKSYGKSDRFAMVWRFLFGLCSRKHEHSYFSQQVVHFDNEIVYEFLVSIGKDGSDESHETEFSDIMLLYHCALESEDDYISTFFASILGGQFEESYDSLYDCMAVMHILRYTSSCQEVVIDLSGCSLSDTQLINLTDILSGVKDRLKIQKLSLNDNKITDKGIADLFCRASISISSLTELSLDDNNVQNMASLLTTNCSMLTDLSLSNNSLGVTGIESLQIAMDASCLAVLEELDLSNTFTDDTDINGALLISMTSSIAEHCHVLHSLTLSKNNLGLPGAGALGESLPLLTCNLSEYESLWLYLDEVNFDCEAMAAFSNRFYSSNIGFTSENSCTIRLDDNPLGSRGLLQLFKIFRSNTCRITNLQLDNICSPDDFNSECPHKSQFLLELEEQVFNCYSNLTMLYLSKNNDKRGIYISMLSIVIQAGVLNNLECLYLSNTFTDDDAKNGTLLAIFLSLVVHHCSQLRRLDLSNNNFGIPGAYALGESFPRLINNQNLVMVNLQETRLDYEAVEVFSRFLLASSAVSTESQHLDSDRCLDLQLNGNPLGISGLLTTLQAFKNEIYSVTSLWLSDVSTSKFSDQDIQQSTVLTLNSRFCFKNQTLKCLNLNKNDFAGEAGLILSTLFQTYQSLEELKCQRCCLTSADMTECLTNLKQFQTKSIKLKTWDLWKNSIEDRAVNALVQCIPIIFPSLEEVDLGDNPVGDEAKSNLNKCLKSNEHKRLAREHAENKTEEEAYRKATLTEWMTTTSIPSNVKKQSEFHTMWKELLTEMTKLYLNFMVSGATNSKKSSDNLLVSAEQIDKDSKFKIPTDSNGSSDDKTSVDTEMFCSLPSLKTKISSVRVSESDGITEMTTLDTTPSQHKTCSTIPELTLTTLDRGLKTLTKPIQLGVKLGIPQYVIEIIQQDNRSDTEGQKIALFKYIAKNYQSFGITWTSIANALRDIHDGDLSLRIREQYCSSPVEESEKSSVETPK